MGDDTKKKLADAKKAINTTKHELEGARARTFGLVTLLVVSCYIVFIILLTLFVIVSSFRGSPWQEAQKDLLEILKIGIIPITSTVIGYYIGRRK